METQTGTQVGQYILEDKLGEGGMAEVWRARNAVLGHSVAIKFLTPRFAGNPEVEHRFLEEGKRQANLQHSNIVSAFDFLYVDDRSFLIMKFIKGESLDHRLFKLQAPMPLAAVLSISRDVLGALDYAHTEGVVHRDIKPSNILLENTGRAYVLDFGIALALGQQRVTRVGAAIGTPHYMSPEQIVGSKALDHRSDIYSYGCVLYQMLTETPPFDFKEGEGDTEYFVKDQHLRQPARPLRELNPDVPEQIEQVVMRCLEKKPADRYDSCHDVLAALTEPIREQAPLPPRRPAGPVPTPTKLESAEMLAAAWEQKNPRVTAYMPVVPEPPQAAAPAYVPPPTPARRGTPPAVFALAGVLALAAAGGGYFWYSHKTEPASHNDDKIVQNEPKKDLGTADPNAGKPVVPVVKKTVVRPKKETSSTQAADNRLPPNPLPDPVEPPKKDPVIEQPVTPPPLPVAQSGVLHCPGTPVPKNGALTFTVPNKPLQYDFDHTRWVILQPKVRSLGDSKTITLVSIAPGYQTSCDIPWHTK
jgi:serine/threonine-protein kinase